MLKIFLKSGKLSRSFLIFVCPLGEKFPAWASHSWSRPTRPRTVGEYEYCLLLVTLISVSTIPTMLPLDNFWTCWTPSICQHVNEKTHANGHTLDLVISNAINHFFNDVKATDPPISDHLAVHSTLHLEKPRFVKKVFSSRKLRGIDMTSFRSDIGGSVLLQHQDDLHVVVNNYDEVLWSLLDKHAPVKERVVTVRPSAR